VNVLRLTDGLLALEMHIGPELHISGIAFDSRLVKPGDVFVAIPGLKIDASRFVAEAVKRGAVVIVGEDRATLSATRNWILVKDARAALAFLSAAFFGHPTELLDLVAITGTNGKTSLTYILESIAVAAGRLAGVMGTVECRYAGRTVPMKHTTPESPVFNAHLREMADAKCDCAFVEVSSHAIRLRRADFARFRIAVFCNLSQDHLDFHKTMEEYAAAKFELFTRILRESPRRIAAVVNLDDEYGARLAALIDYPMLSYGIDSASAAVRAENLTMTATGLRFSAVGPWGTVEVASPLVGRHNVYNLLAALSVAHLLRIEPEAAVRGIADLSRIRGRLESVENPFGVGIWIDYCHTPDAIEKVLAAVRPVVKGRLFCVIGAGGDRDKDKRPKMGAAAERASDIAVITSDNPRTESPLAIIDDVTSGMSPEYRTTRAIVVPDRALAIEAAIGMARPGDGIVIGGKGHETYIERFGTRTHFDDREEALKVVEALTRRTA